MSTNSRESVLKRLAIKWRRAKNLPSLFARAFGRYQWPITLMAVLSFLSGTLEGLGITTVIPLFSVIVGGEATDAISRAIADFFAYLHLLFTAKFLLGFMVCLFFAKAVLLFFSQQLTAYINSDFEKKMRSSLLLRTFRRIGHFCPHRKWDTSTKC